MIAVQHTDIAPSSVEDIARRLDAYVASLDVPARHRFEPTDVMTPCLAGLLLENQGNPLRHLSYAVGDGEETGTPNTRQITGTASGNRGDITLQLLVSYQYVPGEVQEYLYRAMGFAEWLKGRVLDCDNWVLANELFYVDRVRRTTITTDGRFGSYFTFALLLPLTLPTRSR